MSGESRVPGSDRSPYPWLDKPANAPKPAKTAKPAGTPEPLSERTVKIISTLVVAFIAAVGIALIGGLGWWIWDTATIPTPEPPTTTLTPRQQMQKSACDFVIASGGDIPVECS